MQPTEFVPDPPAASGDPEPDNAEPRSEDTTTALLAPESDRTAAARGSRRPGRPLEMSPNEVLDSIRQLSQRKQGLFRIHLTSPGLYARARRLFGSWSAAVRSAGIDYELSQGLARARSLQTRRRNRRRSPAVRSGTPSGASNL